MNSGAMSFSIRIRQTIGGFMQTDDDNHKISCKRCGSFNDGLICEYCGSLVKEISSNEEEKLALETYMALLESAPIDHKARILKNGFLPNNPLALIKAGNNSLIYTGFESKEEAVKEINDGAASRIEAILSKLSIINMTNEQQSAARKFKFKLRFLEILLAFLIIYSIIILFLSCVVFPFILMKYI
jgi:hypothetical protein